MNGHVRRQLGACGAASLRYLWRNRLLLVMGLVLLLLLLLQTIPYLVGLFISESKKFGIILQVFRFCDLFIYLIVSLMGLMCVSHEQANRSFKMIITKPCRIETWLVAQYLTGAAIALAGYLALAALAVALSLWWGLPLQAGLALVTLEAASRTLMSLAWLMLLGAVLHPVLAAIAAVIVRDGLPYMLLVFTLSGLSLAEKSEKAVLVTTLTGVKWFFKLIYLGLPMFSPCEHETQKIHYSWRVNPADWLILGKEMIYAAFFIAFCYFLTVTILKRKKQI